MIKASSSELGNMGLIPAGQRDSRRVVKLSATTWPFCVALSQSVARGPTQPHVLLGQMCVPGAWAVVIVIL